MTFGRARDFKRSKYPNGRFFDFRFFDPHGRINGQMYGENTGESSAGNGAAGAPDHGQSTIGAALCPSRIFIMVDAPPFEDDLEVNCATRPESFLVYWHYFRGNQCRITGVISVILLIKKPVLVQVRF